MNEGAASIEFRDVGTTLQVELVKLDIAPGNIVTAGATSRALGDSERQCKTHLLICVWILNHSCKTAIAKLPNRNCLAAKPRVGSSGMHPNLHNDHC